MTSNTIVEQVREAVVQARQDEGNLKGSADTGWWLATPVVRGIAREYYRPLRGASKEQIFALCEELLEAGSDPERTIAFEWAYRCRKQYEVEDFERFERWLKHYVDGWGSCDDFCTHAFGALIDAYPALIERTLTWTDADDRWLRPADRVRRAYLVRRASAVVLIPGLRRGRHLDAAFRVADRLLLDEDDLVQKGYGWMLKVASQTAPDRVFDYVMEHKDVMPRTALRYAIEKLPPARRKEAMAR